MKNVIEHKMCVSKSSTTFVENSAVNEIMWRNIIERGRPQMTIWRMPISCWIPKATNTHSEYVIFIAFFQRQKMAARKALNVTFIRELEL